MQPQERGPDRERHATRASARATPSMRASVVQIQPVAGLDLDRRDPFGNEAAGAHGERRSASPHRWRRASHRPSIECHRRRAQSARRMHRSSRCSNSAARLPPYTRCVWQSIKPGVIHRPWHLVQSARACASGRAPPRRHLSRQCARRYRKRGVVHDAIGAAPRAWSPDARRSRPDPSRRCRWSIHSARRDCTPATIATNYPPYTGIVNHVDVSIRVGADRRRWLHDVLVRVIRAGMSSPPS